MEMNLFDLLLQITAKKLMSMTLHVVIPPHPLIGHWLSILRIESTPAPIYSTALEQLGKWLTYEALREWLPHRKEEVLTSDSTTQGIIIEPSVPNSKS